MPERQDALNPLQHEWWRLNASAEALAARLRHQKQEMRGEIRRAHRDGAPPRRPQHNHLPSNAGSHDSPMSVSDDVERYSPYHHRRRPSPYRSSNRSASPPSVKDVPGLSRADTHNSLAPSSCSSSRAPSSRSTPASVSTCSSAPGDDVVVADENASPASSALSYSYVNIPALPPQAKQQPATTSQPSKKIKTTGNMGSSGSSLMAKFFASAAGAYMGGRIARPLA